jgi:hypothetical protein
MIVNLRRKRIERLLADLKKSGQWDPPISRRSAMAGLGATIIVPKLAQAQTHLLTGAGRAVACTTLCPQSLSQSVFLDATDAFYAHSISQVSTDPSAQAWANQVVTNGGTVSAPRLALVSTMIAGLKADGVWSLLDRLFVLAAENTQSALTDWKALELATNTNSTTFTTDRGYTASGAASALTSTYNFSTATNWSLNSALAGFYINNTPVFNGKSQIKSSSTLTCNGLLFSGSTAFLRFNADNSGGGFSGFGSQGSTIGSRTNNTTTGNYANGASVGTDNTSATIVRSETLSMINGDSDNRFAYFVVGGGLTAAQVSAGGRTTGLDGRLLTFLTAIGGN